MANEQLEVAIGEDGNGSNKLIEALNRLTAGLEKVGDTSEKSGKGLKSYGDSAKTAATQSSSLSSTVDKVKTGFSGFASALSGVTALLSAGKLLKYADEYTSISQKLKLVTTDQKKLNEMIETSFGIAQRNSTNLSDTTELYGKLSMSGKSLGKSQGEIAKITETVTQAIGLTGPSAEAAANGLRQFNQGLDGGALRGDEFQSVLENIPGLATAIQAGFSSAGPISREELRSLAEQGKLTGKALLEALERAAPNVAKLAATSTDTVEKAFIRLDNAVKKFVGQTNEAYGVTALLAKGIDLITNNIGPAVIALGVFTAILAAGALAGAIQSIAGLSAGFIVLTRGIVASTAAMLTNPLIAVATLAAIASVLGVMKLTGVTFSDVATKIGGFAGQAGKAAIEAAKVGTASATAAPGVKAAGDAAGGAATSVASLNTASSAAPAAVAAAVDAYGGLLGVQTKVGAALKASADAATALPPAIAASAAGAGAASAGFTAVKQSLDGVGFSTLETTKGFEVIRKKLVDELPPSMKVTAASVGNLKLSYDALNPTLATLNPNLNMNAVAITAQNSPNVAAAASAGTYKLSLDALNPTLVTLNTNLVPLPGLLTNSGTQAAAATASTFKLAEGTARLSESGSALGPVLEKYATGSKEAAKSADDLAKGAEKAREALTAQAQATEKAKKASDDFKNSLEKITGAYNSMGEKIESATEAVQRFAAAKEKANQRIKDSLENLKQYYTTADTATSSTNSLGSAVSSIGGGFTDLANDTALATSQLTAFTQAANAAAVASSNASQGLSIRQQLNTDESNAAQRRAEAGSGTSRSGSRVTVSAGNGDGSSNSIAFDVYSVGGIDVGSTMDPTLQRVAMGSETHQQKYGINGWNLYLARNQFPTTGPDFNPEAIWKGFLYGGGSDAITNPALIKKPNMMNSSFFARGGSFMVGGSGGTDSQPVSFMASPNERVTIETPAQMHNRAQMEEQGSGGGRRREQPVNLVVNVRTDDIDSFKRNRKQIAQDMIRKLSGA